MRTELFTFVVQRSGFAAGRVSPDLEKQLSLFFFPPWRDKSESVCVCVCGRDSVHVCMKAQTCPHRKQAAVYYYAANEAV